MSHTYTHTGITIPAGTVIDIRITDIHRDPDYWPEPDHFKPERFLEPTHHPFAYIPFGCGPRVCIGQRFALNDMCMCVAKLFTAYEFTLAPGFKLAYCTGSM